MSDNKPAPVVAEVRRAPLDLDAAANERDAIETLLSDRSEAGTYAKVDGLLTELEVLRGRLRGLPVHVADIPDSDGENCEVVKLADLAALLTRPEEPRG